MNNIDISPFKLIEGKTNYSVILSDWSDKYKIFENHGWIGNGYDMQSVFDVALNEKANHLEKEIFFDSEADMFCFYGKKDSVIQFAIISKQVYDDEVLFKDLLSRATLD